MTYQWCKDGNSISGATGSSYSIANVNSSDAGVYNVKVTNGGGTVTSGDATLTVLAPPAITTQPADQGVAQGQTATFSVQATGAGTLTYQWSFNGTALSGATSSSLVLTNVQTPDAGAYAVAVANTYGSVNSSNANLAVYIVPVITVQPQGLILLAGNTAGFSAAATGSPAPSFQWRLNGTNIAGATNTTLLRTNLQPIAAGNYTFVASNPGGSATSQVAVLTVIPLVQQSWVARYSGPSTGTNQDIPRAIITDSSGNVYVTGSSPATNGTFDIVTVKYDASGNQVWSARYDGGVNGNDEPASITMDSALNVYVAGYTTLYTGNSGSEYITLKYSPAGVLLWAAFYDSGSFRVDRANKVLTDTNGNVYVTGVGTKGSGADFATVKYNSAGQQQWVARYDGPAAGYDEARSLALDSAGNIYVAGASTGNGSALDMTLVKYNSQGNQQWAKRYDGGNLQDDIAYGLSIDAQDNIYVAGTAGTTTNADFALLKYSTDGTRQWVRRTSGPGLARDEAYSLALDGLGNPYCAGLATTSAGLDYATVKTAPDGTAQWAAFSGFPGNEQVAGLSVDFGGNAYVTGTVSNNFLTLKYNSSGVLVWSAVYDNGGIEQATAVTLDNSGNVFVAGSSAGTDSGDYAVVKYSQPAAVTFVTQPTNQFVAGGATAVFAGTVSGFGTVTYQWYFKGSVLPGATNSTLILNSAGVSDVGDYFLLASNAINVAVSSKARLVVPPLITTQPTDTTVVYNTAVTFSVTVQNTDSAAYQWYFNNSPLAGATSRTYSISKAKTSNAGNYFVVITNPAGSITSAVARLTVLVPTGITTDPHNQTVVLGQNATFTVSATGTGPLGYQWNFNGAPLPGATASALVVSNAQPTDAGSYTVVVSNIVDMSTSAVATLTVLIPPAIVAQPQDQAVMAGQPAVLNVAASGSGPLSYQWCMNGTPLSAATNSSLALTPAQISDAGHYSVLVTNAAGSVASSTADLIVTNPPPATLSASADGLSATGFTFQISVPTQTTYIIQASINLQDWTPIATNSSASTPITFTDTAASNYPSRFYRVVVP
jgi:uncharacterized delta-60 repeat protein